MSRGWKILRFQAQGPETLRTVLRIIRVSATDYTYYNLLSDHADQPFHIYQAHPFA